MRTKNVIAQVVNSVGMFINKLWFFSPTQRSAGRGVVNMVSEDELKILKVKVTEKKVIVGARGVLRALRAGSIGTIYLATNCQAKMADDIKHYAGLISVGVVQLSMDNEEFGVFCKKNYFISALALRA